MAGASVSDLSDVLKRLFPQTELVSLLYENQPMLGMVRKDETFGGNDLRLTLQYAPTGGGSATFADAQGNKAAAKYKGFLLTRQKDYSIYSLETELIRASQGRANSIVSAMKAEMKGAMNNLKRSIGISLFRNGGGSRGRISSGSSSTTLTLTNKRDAKHFEVGMKISSSDTDGTSGADDDEDLTISAVDVDAGTISKTGGNWDAGGNFAANDYLFRDGDFGAVLTGLSGWIPATAPTGGDSHFGVDRSAHPTRLAGIRYTASANDDGTIGRAMINASARVVDEGGTPDCIFMNPLDWAHFVNEIGSKTEYEKATAQSSSGPVANVGYKALMVHGAGNQPMKVIADLNCEKGRAYMLTMDTWTLLSIGPAAGWLDDDGQKLLRESSADALEGRLGGYMQLGCDAPAYNANIDISALVPAA